VYSFAKLTVLSGKLYFFPTVSEIAKLIDLLGSFTKNFHVTHYASLGLPEGYFVVWLIP
jgi:hypothetical protein